jgi:glutathione S-transferase
MAVSGNCYKIRLLLAKLGIPFRNLEISFGDEGTKSPAYLAKNPNGMTPMLELPDGRVIAESGAILLHLAEGTRFLPVDAYERALTYQWLFFEQYSHEPYIAVRRALTILPHRAADATPERMASTLKGGNKALSVMETHLAKRPYFGGVAMSVADIALYGYTHVAEEGGFTLEAYPSVGAWLDRVAADPGHEPIGGVPQGDGRPDK